MIFWKYSHFLHTIHWIICLNKILRHSVWVGWIKNVIKIIEKILKLSSQDLLSIHLLKIGLHLFNSFTFSSVLWHGKLVFLSSSLTQDICEFCIQYNSSLWSSSLYLVVSSCSALLVFLFLNKSQVEFETVSQIVLSFSWMLLKVCLL